MRSPIHLPVVNRLRVLNYPLYPGSARQGLDLSFENGVTVIAGVNGIGKTTLLNLLLRMLLGPTNPSKAATRDMGRVSTRSLTTSRAFKFFQDRIAATLSADTAATLTFTIGDTQVAITRTLVNLQITKLIVNRKVESVPTNGQFLERMASLAGLASAYDFHMVVRYVQFFTEERLPLLWSPTAQLELFKMLFVDLKTARKLNQLFADIQSKDTEYRNRLYQYNARVERQEQARANAGLSDATLEAVREQLNAARASLAEANRAYIAANGAVMLMAKQRLEAEQKIDGLQIDLDKETHAFHHADAAYIAQALPGLEDKLALLMQGLGSNLGCFMCGRRGKKEAAMISKRLRDHHCFVCNATLPKPEAAKVTPLAAASVHKIERRMTALTEQIIGQRHALELTDREYSQALEAVRPLAAQRHQLAVEVDQLAARIPHDGESSTIQVELDAEKAELEELAKARTHLGVQFRQQLDTLTAEMAQIENDLSKRLTKYAEDFLHETVAVRFTRNAPYKIATGAAQVNLPTFRISMTSSTHLSVQERTAATSVSESQKEFLDLAFRMTLLDMLADGNATMLIMETPEASLDSWFIARAAQMIRRFAPDRGPRMLIATSNVNGTTMIPALLGLTSGTGATKTLPRSKHARLVNLMALAAEPGVLQIDEAKLALTEELERYYGG